jgi:hypothetical protein
MQVTKKRRIVILDDDDDDVMVTTVGAASADPDSKPSVAAVENVTATAVSSSNVTDRPSAREIWALRVLGLLKEDDTFNGPRSRRVWRSIQGLVAAGAITDIDNLLEVTGSPAAGQQPLSAHNTEGMLECQHRGLNIQNYTQIFTYSGNFVAQVPITCTSTMLSSCNTWNHPTQRR